MAVLRSLTKLAQKTNRKPLCLFISPTPTPNPTTLRNLIRSSSSPYSICNPNGGPLFLCYPPWKLLLSATPIYYQSTPKLPETKSPIKLGLKNSVRDFDNNNNNRKDSVIVGGSNNDGEVVKSFVNWPNFISITRLLSGPLLGWYPIIFIINL